MKPLTFVFNVTIALILSLGGVSSAIANPPEYIGIYENIYPRIEFTFAGGLALQTGYLTTQDSVGTYVLGVNFLLPGGLMSFDWQGFRADHNTGEFPLTNNKSVTVSAASFTPYICIFNKEVWNIYLGIGFMEVSLYQTSPENMVNYGTFVLSGLLRYELGPSWSVQYKTQWYNVSQTVNDQTTSLQISNQIVGMGYSFL